MKNSILSLFTILTTASFAQISAPKLSPKASVKQEVGLTQVECVYSRPAKRDRVVFGDVVPYGEVWRTGANENTLFTIDAPLVFGKDTLAKGTYALYTKPEKSEWTIYFYTETTNWGTPEKWDDTKVAMSLKSVVKTTKDVTENFTISIDDVSTKSATLNLSWDMVKVSVPFSVLTADQMTQSIAKVMAGPSANDYYRAADYYLNENIEQEKALEYINKAIEMSPSAPFWFLRRKSLILANLGRYKEAIAAAEESMVAAEKAGNNTYVEMNKKSIEAWKKK